MGTPVQGLPLLFVELGISLQVCFRMLAVSCFLYGRLRLPDIVSVDGFRFLALGLILLFALVMATFC